MKMKWLVLVEKIRLLFYSLGKFCSDEDHYNRNHR